MGKMIKCQPWGVSVLPLTKDATFKTTYGEAGKKVASWFVDLGSIFWIEKECVILLKEINIKPTA